ncbi:predicted protein [Uncinocarpus reesii 1704]|uniref:Uncharacterized protein n=1 Tax=Uncinocarpus reesii (strain UAMH 1704) TaxID=336963 RepID=C4JYN3_UNCRE|nr:uncharacterized protein UREG_07284 [Uncinocarpus reesii 1704]EEP82419.1 predicted protein [Uncinocarpus reesii 1704]
MASPLSSSSVRLKPENPYSSPLPLTPPETEDNILWNPESQLPLHQLSSHDSNPLTTMHNSTSCTEDLSAKESSESDSAPEKSQQQAAFAVQGAQSVTSLMRVTNQNQYPEDSSDGWLQDAILPLVSSLPLPKSPGESVKLVSQTLPCPPSDSSAPALPQCAFTPIVKAIQNRFQQDDSPYINIVHAVPPMFSLSSLPTSPPSTPHLLFGGDDYFSNTIFSSAVAVPSYPHSDPGAFQASAGHHISTPIVPPFSVHVAIVERYLPPSSPQEYRSLFLNEGPSMLRDRLFELSPGGGSLMFIYPTKKGADTFIDNYLSPILAPHLRQLAVINGISSDVGNALGRLPAIAYMDDFEGMRARVLALCDAISSKNHTSSNLACRKTNFTMTYAGKSNVPLDRKLWTEWYIQQETPRAREILNHYWRKGHRLPDNAMTNASQRHPTTHEVTGASLLREIINGVRHRPYPDGFEPDCGLELGVFVIRRSI